MRHVHGRAAIAASGIIALMGIVGGGPAHADVITVGNGSAIGRSILNNTTLDPNFPTTTYPRYQQVYGAPAFSTLTEPVAITSLSFFAAEVIPPFFPGFPATVIPEEDRDIADGTYTIRLSTTPKPVDGLGDVFDDNWGSDVQVFYTGSLADTLTITGSTPFIYDPSQGNLLLDIIVHTQEGNGGYLLRDIETSLQFNNPANRDQMSSRIGTNTTSAVTTGLPFTRSGGYATEFEYTAAPEPSSAAVLVIAGLALAARPRRVRRKAPGLSYRGGR